MTSFQETIVAKSCYRLAWSRLCSSANRSRLNSFYQDANVSVFVTAIYRLLNCYLTKRPIHFSIVFCPIISPEWDEVKYDLKNRLHSKLLTISRLLIQVTNTIACYIHCVPKNVHLFIFRITISKIKRF